MARWTSRGRASLLALTLACACGKRPPDVGDDAGAGTKVASAPSDNAGRFGADAGSAATNVRDAGADARSPDALAYECSDARALGGKSIGHTSAVFKLELSNGKKVAWKPNAKKVRGRYKGEIAAFRLASVLAIDNVLPACPHAFDVAAITAALSPNAEAAKLLAGEAIVEDGKIYGASIAWHDGLSFWPLEKEPLRTDTRTWLTAGKDIPPAKTDLARQASMLVAFDFITGNWDRYSGENVGIDKAGALVLFIDNDAAFMEAPPKELVGRNKTLLDATDRFSRDFVARVRKLDEESLTRAFGEESPGRPLLTTKVVSLVARRLKELLAVVDAKIGARGEAETLYFR